MGVQMASKYPGKCRLCGRSFAVGTEIDYDRKGAKGAQAAHWLCAHPPIEVPDDSDEFDRLYPFVGTNKFY